MIPRSVDDSFDCEEASILELLAISSRYSMLLQDLDKDRPELFLELLLHVDVVDGLLLVHGRSHCGGTVYIDN